jgi:hypothetical protein
MSTETKFTPGPWHVAPCHDHKNNKNTGRLSCIGVRDESGHLIPETTANLTLKAAAPDLYEIALRAREIGRAFGTDAGWRLFHDAEAALASATPSAP